MSIRLDERGDSEGNFSVLAFKPTTFSDDDINCTYSMIPVGHFHQSNKEFPVSILLIKILSRDVLFFKIQFHRSLIKIQIAS